MTENETSGDGLLRIAIPTADGRLCMHFGHCNHFALLGCDAAKKRILDSGSVEPPPHEPGLLPRWLHEQGVDLVIAGGMGGRAQTLFAERGIQVIVGAPTETPKDLAQAYLDGDLQSGANACDH